MAKNDNIRKEFEVTRDEADRIVDAMLQDRYNAETTFSDVLRNRSSDQLKTLSQNPNFSSLFAAKPNLVTFAETTEQAAKERIASEQARLAAGGEGDIASFTKTENSRAQEIINQKIGEIKTAKITEFKNTPPDIELDRNAVFANITDAETKHKFNLDELYEATEKSNAAKPERFNVGHLATEKVINSLNKTEHISDPNIKSKRDGQIAELKENAPIKTGGVEGVASDIWGSIKSFAKDNPKTVMWGSVAAAGVAMFTLGGATPILGPVISMLGSLAMLVAGFNLIAPMLGFESSSEKPKPTPNAEKQKEPGVEQAKGKGKTKGTSKTNELSQEDLLAETDAAWHKLGEGKVSSTDQDLPIRKEIKDAYHKLENGTLNRADKIRLQEVVEKINSSKDPIDTADKIGMLDKVSPVEIQIAANLLHVTSGADLPTAKLDGQHDEFKQIWDQASDYQEHTSRDEKVNKILEDGQISNLTSISRDLTRNKDSRIIYKDGNEVLTAIKAEGGEIVGFKMSVLEASPQYNSLNKGTVRDRIVDRAINFNKDGIRINEEFYPQGTTYGDVKFYSTTKDFTVSFDRENGKDISKFEREYNPTGDGTRRATIDVTPNQYNVHIGTPSETYLKAVVDRKGDVRDIQDDLALKNATAEYTRGGGNGKDLAGSTPIAMSEEMAKSVTEIATS